MLAPVACIGVAVVVTEADPEIDPDAAVGAAVTDAVIVLVIKLLLLVVTIEEVKEYGTSTISKMMMTNMTFLMTKSILRWTMQCWIQ